MEILGVVDYYFGLIKGIGALSGAGWGSPLWACQPTDYTKRIVPLAAIYQYATPDFPNSLKASMFMKGQHL